MNATNYFQLRKILGVGAVGLLVLAAETARAAADPVGVCESAKIGAAGVRSICLAREHTEARLGAPSNPARCETEFDQAIVKIDVSAARSGVTCRYLDGDDGTITDLNTLLQWEKKTSDGSVHDVSNLYTWAISCPDGEPCLPTGTAFTEFLGTLNYCASIPSGGPPTSIPGPMTGGLAGHCDWRLPSIFELQGILQTQCTQGPCIDPAFGHTYLNPDGFGYLSSTSSNLPFRYWFVRFDSDPPNAIATIYKTGMPGGAVRAVRGGR
jgi:hypothetical protein